MTTDTSPVDGAPLQHFERQLLENYPFLVVLMTVLLAAPFAEVYEGPLRDWDWLLISGILVFLVAYPLSLILPDQVGTALRELQSRGILRPEEAISVYEYRLNAVANRWASIGGIALPGVMCLAWLAAFWEALQAQPWQYTLEFTIPGILIEMALSIAAGRFLGRGLCYGTLANRLRVEGITLRPIPSHWDGMAGLGPVGSIYFAHAVFIALFLAFLSVWILLFPLLGPQYASWRLPYVGLLTFMLAFEVIIVFRPLHTFNRILLKWKQEMLGDLSISRARRREHEITASEQNQRFMREQRDRIEQMPTWVLGKTKRWSLIGVNILAMTPFFLAAAGFIQVGQ